VAAGYAKAADANRSYVAPIPAPTKKTATTAKLFFVWFVWPFRNGHFFFSIAHRSRFVDLLVREANVFSTNLLLIWKKVLVSAGCHLPPFLCRVVFVG
jgi:hypothetical protein